MSKQTFKVVVHRVETLVQEINIEADSDRQAKEIAEAMGQNGQIDFEEVVGIDYEAIKATKH